MRVRRVSGSRARDGLRRGTRLCLHPAGELAEEASAGRSGGRCQLQGAGANDLCRRPAATSAGRRRGGALRRRRRVPLAVQQQLDAVSERVCLVHGRWSWQHQRLRESHSQRRFCRAGQHRRARGRGLRHRRALPVPDVAARVCSLQRARWLPGHRDDVLRRQPRGDVHQRAQPARRTQSGRRRRLRPRPRRRAAVPRLLLLRHEAAAEASREDRRGGRGRAAAGALQPVGAGHLGTAVRRRRREGCAAAAAASSCAAGGGNTGGALGAHARCDG
mmetsp:Transcript_2934/g.7632  ORF Transcript_2934/g.7632 Transcript_2934/m.7632 type:complete len:275 (-) Transcript_2934:21-845(-)